MRQVRIGLVVVVVFFVVIWRKPIIGFVRFRAAVQSRSFRTRLGGIAVFGIGYCAFLNRISILLILLNIFPTADEADDENEPDSYLAHLDPDVLHEFLNLTKIQTKNDDMHEGTAFFLLMTFPFYEHEWDLVGFVLEEIFGDDEEEE